MNLCIVISCDEDKSLSILKAVAENAAISASGELRSAYVERPASSNPLIRALGLGVHTRTELYPVHESTTDLLDEVRSLSPITAHRQQAAGKGSL
mgnify:CR=1 FL=1